MEPEPESQSDEDEMPEGVPPTGAEAAWRRTPRGRAPLRGRLQERRRTTIADAVERTRERLRGLEEKEAEALELSELQAQHKGYARIWGLDRHPLVLEYLEATVAFDASCHRCLVGFAHGDVLAVTAKPRLHWWEGYNETERATAAIDTPTVLPRVGFFPACPGVRMARAPFSASVPGGTSDPRRGRRSSVPAAFAVTADAAGRVLRGLAPEASRSPPAHTRANVQAGLDFIEGRLRKTEHALQEANDKVSAMEAEAAVVAASIAAVSSVYGQGAGPAVQAEMARLGTARRHVEHEFVRVEELQRNLAKSMEVYSEEVAQARALLQEIQDSEEAATRAKIVARGGRKTRRFSLN